MKLKMVVIDYNAKVINQSVYCIKTAKSVTGALAATKRTFSKTHPFNKALGGW